MLILKVAMMNLLDKVLSRSVSTMSSRKLDQSNEGYSHINKIRNESNKYKRRIQNTVKYLK